METDDGAAGSVPGSEERRGLLLLACLVLSLLTATDPGRALAIVGIAGLATGFGLRRAAIRTLGSGFTARATTADRRVHTGPYRWLDHPGELGLAAASLGFVVLCGSAVGDAAWALAVVVPSVQRCRAENQAWATSRQ